MAYIPKYLLKRLVPKDALTIETINGKKCGVLKIKNVISPLEVPAEIPKDILDGINTTLSFR